MVGQGHFCKPTNFFDRSYLPFINGGTTLNNRFLLTGITVCIESCGTVDISSSIIYYVSLPDEGNENKICHLFRFSVYF